MLGLCLTLNYSNSNVNASQNSDMYYNDVTNNVNTSNVPHEKIDRINFLRSSVEGLPNNDMKIINNLLNELQNALELYYSGDMDNGKYQIASYKNKILQCIDDLCKSETLDAAYSPMYEQVLGFITDGIFEKA